MGDERRRQGRRERREAGGGEQVRAGCCWFTWAFYELRVAEGERDTLHGPPEPINHDSDSLLSHAMRFLSLILHITNTHLIPSLALSRFDSLR